MFRTLLSCLGLGVTVFAAGLVLFALPVAAESSSSSSSSNEEGAVEDEATTLLAWSFAVGDEFYVRDAQTWRSVSEEPGAADGRQEVSGSTEYLNAYRVLALDEESGTATLELTFHAIRAVHGEDTFDSRKPDELDLDQFPQFEQFKRLASNSVELTVRADGSVERVEGYAELFVDWLEQLREDNPVRAAMLRDSLSNEFFADEYATYFRLLPGREVARGQSWSHAWSVSMGWFGTMHTTQTMTYWHDEISEDGRVAVLRLEGEITLSPTDSIEQDEVPPVPAQVTLQHGKINGVAYVDPQSGRLNAMRKTTETTYEFDYGLNRILERQVMTDTSEHLTEEQFQAALQ